jgi:hypothetical protein
VGRTEGPATNRKARWSRGHELPVIADEAQATLGLFW